MSNKKIFPKLYSGVKIGLGAVCTSVGGMLHYLYGWSHDFAHEKWVGLPFTNPGLGVTGAQWEYANLIGAEAVGVGLGIAGGYLIASGYRDLKALAVQVKSAAQKLNEKCSIKQK